ncbi:hypothetical protein FRC06_005846 [Ceratobasidium sp. 370]|nr:hypothetical protein FRC06_005846 [Ceratobasidium sp. 370]
MWSVEQAAQHHRQLAKQWDQLLQKARNIPGFQSFLRPKKISELISAARHSMIVVVNVHHSRCDALSLIPGASSVVHIPLPSFSAQKAIETHRNLTNSLGYADNRARSLDRRPVFYDITAENQFELVLETLWIDVVRPILDHLGALEIHPLDKLPRITWCATGTLAFLPLHAAGCYSEPQARVSDFVVSSYTPTISALLKQAPAPGDFRGILSVGQAAAAGASPLPGTIAELDQIQKLAILIPHTRLDGSTATAEAVLKGMEQNSWVHLACHASQNTADPTASALLLHGSNLDLATVTRKSLKNVGLAFLSACETATGDEKLPEEAVHLAAGMIMAGYPSVIGTMWSIKDQDAPLVAKEVYTRLLNGTPDVRGAAQALHVAVGRLRDQVGDKEFARWVPYIHIGI